MRDITERETTIEKLHDEERLSFKAIGERLKLSASSVASSYHSRKRKRREEERRRLEEKSAQRVVFFELTVAEAEILTGILHSYLTWKMGSYGNSGKHKIDYVQDVDYKIAYELFDRLLKLG